MRFADPVITTPSMPLVLDFSRAMNHDSWLAVMRNGLVMETAEQYCRERVRRLDHDRFLCIALAPAELRRVLLAVSAFALELALVRETVHEPLAGRMRLQFWRDGIEGLTRNTVDPAQPVLRELAPLVAVHPGLRSDLQAMIDARELDLDPDPPGNLDALQAYAADTSGRLAGVWCRLAGREMEESILAGTAYGLVGVMRALPFRPYSSHGFVPADLARQHDLESWRQPSDALFRVIADVVERSRDILAPIAKADPAGFRPAWLHGVLARRYGSDLEKRGYDPWVPNGATASLHRYGSLIIGDWMRRLW